MSTPATTFPRSSSTATALVRDWGVRLVVASVQDSIDRGRVVEDIGPRASRNRLQSVTLLDAIAEHGFDAAFGGGRRDEDKARAKERILSFRDRQGRWDPRQQRPEPWALLNPRIRKGEHLRAFPLSNWTELDIWRYIERHAVPLPDIYFSHQRTVVERDGMLLAVGGPVEPEAGETPFEAVVRYRTVGDASCTGAVESTALDVYDVLAEVAAARITERGATRADDTFSESRDGRPQARGLLLMSSKPLISNTSTTLRIATAGSVDDGKSTLIGRLLHDTKTVFEDQLQAVVKASRRYGDGETNLALLTDGLRAEREQGITIDVAHRYFATPRRSFIVADTPGHAQYTRNMVTGASTSDLAIVLVDARHGVLDQTRRHALIAVDAGRAGHRARGQQDGPRRLGRQTGSTPSPREVDAFVGALPHPVPVTAIPISALLGDNVVDRSEHTPWYDGPRPARLPRGVRDPPAHRGGRTAARAARHPPARWTTRRLPRPGRRRERRLVPCRRRRHRAAGRTHVHHRDASNAGAPRSTRPAPATPSCPAGDRRRRGARRRARRGRRHPAGHRRRRAWSTCAG